MVAPLTNLNTSYVWSSYCQAAFKCVKNLICSFPVLAAPVYDKLFKIQVDASEVGAEGPLSTKGELTILSASSQVQLSPNELFRNWFGPWSFLRCLLGHLCPWPFTPTNPLLTFLHSMHNANHRLMRWLLFLQPYTLSVCHIKSSNNAMTDALSRMPC